MTVKSILRGVFKTLGTIFGIVVLYCILALALPLIEIPAEKTSEPKTVEVFIYTNGVHTDLVLPVKSAQKDWSSEIPYSNTLGNPQGFKYIAIGWGDKGFYLNTPTWADLKFSTAIKAAFWLSESAMHCTFYPKMTVGKDCKRIMLTENQYKRVINFIENKFDRDQNGNFILIKTNAVYGKNDAFYEAQGRYSFLDTCNTWTNNGLKAAGQKAALWTAADFGIFWHYK